MITRLRVRPVNPNHVIRCPQTRRALPKEGGKVPASEFWQRRLMAKDVEEVKDEPKAVAYDEPKAVAYDEPKRNSPLSVDIVEDDEI